MTAVLWFWPVLFVVGGARCIEVGLEATGGVDARLLVAGIACFIVALVPIVGWRWNHVPREAERTPREILRGFLLTGVAFLGVVMGFVYVSFVS